MYNCLWTYVAVVWTQQTAMSAALAAELQTAIQLGNVEQSQQLARQLAEAKAQVIVRIDEGSSVLTPDPDMIRYNIFSVYHFYVSSNNRWQRNYVYRLSVCLSVCLSLSVL